MGFGSYDESEQKQQEVDSDGEDEGVNVHQNDHQGKVSFESEASTDDLVDRLQDMKDDE